MMFNAQEAKDQTQFSLNLYNIAKHSGPLFTISSLKAAGKEGHIFWDLVLV
jgi:hypothetical protein